MGRPGAGETARRSHPAWVLVLATAVSAAAVAIALGTSTGGHAAERAIRRPAASPLPSPLPDLGPVVADDASLVHGPMPRALPAQANPYGLLINLGYPMEEQLMIARSLGVRYMRSSTAILLSDPSLSCPGCDLFRDAGFKLVLTVRNSSVVKGPSSPPTDLSAYRRSVARVLDRYHPALLVVENEEDLSNYYSGTPKQYTQELRAACAEAHRHGTPCSNGGLLSGHLAYAYYVHLLDQGLAGQARDFAERAFQVWQSPLLNSSSGAQEIRDSAARGMEWIRSYRGTGVDYVNFHWYVEDGPALEEVATYLSRLTGRPVITNEIGQRNSSPKSTARMMTAIFNLRIPYAIWLSSDAHLARGLFDPDGTLRDSGHAFAGFVRKHYPQRG